MMSWSNLNMDTKIGGVCGMISGVGSWLLNMKWPVDMIYKIMEAGIVAFVAGVMGVAGKYAFGIVKDWFVKKFLTPKK